MTQEPQVLGTQPARDAAERRDRLPRVPWGAVVLFIVVAFGLAWLCSLPLWLGVVDGSVTGALLAMLIAIGTMFTPAIATLVVVWIARVPGAHRLRFLGMWPLRPAKRVVWFIVLGIVLPILVCVLSLGVAAAFGWIELDLREFSGLQAAIDAQAGPGVIDARAIVGVQFAMIPLGALINIIPAFGEEVGWRGWLLPALRPLGVWPSLIVSGALWGLWHSPLILLGHNFGLLDWRGVALMTIGCVCWGVLLGWSRLRSGSVWPAVFAHGSLNAAAGMYSIVVAAGDPLRMPLINPLGVSGWIVLAIGIGVLVCTGQFGREPELADAPRAAPELADPRFVDPSRADPASR